MSGEASTGMPPTPPTPSLGTPNPHSKFASGEVSKKLAAANTNLSDCNPISALKGYTEVLAELSPGHPCAFLNRSICYLLIGYPHLAVTDAYRALLAAHWAKSDDFNNPYCKQLLTFGRATQTAAELKHNWASKPTCFVGLGKYKWLAKDLASLAVLPKVRQNITPELGEDGKEKQLTPDQMMAMHLVNDAVLKAYYLLALSLWKCGGGAVRSALDILCDARELTFCKSVDCEQIGALENRILQYVVEEMESEKKSKTSAKGNAALEKQIEANEVQKLYLTRYTKVQNELYPWDTYSLTGYDVYRQLDEINENISKIAQGCRARVVKEAGKAPKVSLYATEHIFGPKKIFNESGKFNVMSTRTPEVLLCCDTCCSRLHVSEQLIERAEPVAKRFAAMEAIGKSRLPEASVASNASIELSDLDVNEYLENHPEVLFRKFQQLWPDSNTDTQDGETGGDPILFSQDFKPTQTKSYPPTPPPHGDPNILQQAKSPKSRIIAQGFQICPGCLLTVYCSYQCHVKAIESHHMFFCEMNLDKVIRGYGIPTQFPEVPGEHGQNLLSLLLLRVLANTSVQDCHPLANRWVQLLDGNLDAAKSFHQYDKIASGESVKTFHDDETVPVEDLFPALALLRQETSSKRPKKSSKPKPNLVPWSFAANVRQPIHMLEAMYDCTFALDVSRYDGWVLQTLIAKIEAGMRITRGPRFEKFFDESGELTSQRCVKPDDQKAPDQNPAKDDGEQDSECWFASLHPLSALVRGAEAGEVPNTQLFERDGELICHTLLLQAHPSPFDGGSEMTDVDTDIDGTVHCLRAGDQLLRTSDILPLQMEGDADHKSDASMMTDDCMSQRMDSVFGKDVRTGDTMIDADHTEWEAEVDESEMAMEIECDGEGVETEEDADADGDTVAMKDEIDDDVMLVSEE